jgi:hypothetical protein
MVTDSSEPLQSLIWELVLLAMLNQVLDQDIKRLFELRSGESHVGGWYEAIDKTTRRSVLSTSATIS